MLAARVLGWSPPWHFFYLFVSSGPDWSARSQLRPWLVSQEVEHTNTTAWAPGQNWTFTTIYDRLLFCHIHCSCCGLLNNNISIKKYMKWSSYSPVVAKICVHCASPAGVWTDDSWGLVTALLGCCCWDGLLSPHGTSPPLAHYSAQPAIFATEMLLLCGGCHSATNSSNYINISL